MVDSFVITFAYDSIHNLTRKDQDVFRRIGGSSNIPQPGTYDYTYTYAGRPHAATQIAERTFLYDLNGNQAGWDVPGAGGLSRRNVWDEDNRLQQVTDGLSQQVTFKYRDDETRAVKRATIGGETLYVNSWYTAALGRNQKHVFAGPTRIVTKYEGFPSGEGYGTGAHNLTEVFQFFYHPDHVGSNGYVTDRTGEVWQHLEYFPFGETWINEVTSNRTVAWRFTGQEFDEETKLYYFGARYYDPKTSQWNAPDAALGQYLAGSPADGVFQPRNLALSSYAHQNPIKHLDPNGKSTTAPLALCAGGPVPCAAGATISMVLTVGVGIAVIMNGPSRPDDRPIGAGHNWIGEWQDQNNAPTPDPGDPNDPTGKAITAAATIALGLSGNESSGVTPVLRRNMPRTTVLDRSGRPVTIFGQSGSSSTTPGHEARIESEAARLAESGDYEFVFMQRSWRTATGRLSREREIPDIIGVRRDGRIDAFEVRSQSQSTGELLNKLQAAMRSLRPERRGTIDVIEP